MSQMGGDEPGAKIDAESQSFADAILTGVDRDRIEAKLLGWHNQDAGGDALRQHRAKFWVDCAAYLHFKSVLLDLSQYEPVRGRTEAVALLLVLERHLEAAATIIERFRSHAVYARMSGEVDQAQLSFISDRLEAAIFAGGLPQDLRKEVMRHAKRVRRYAPGEKTVAGDYRPANLAIAATTAARLAEGVADETLFPISRGAGDRSDWLTTKFVITAARMFEAVTQSRPTAHMGVDSQPSPSRFLQFLDALWVEFGKTMNAHSLPSVPGKRFVQKALDL